MSDTVSTLPALPVHGAHLLPLVEVDGYNAETADDEGFLGDRASKSAFREVLDRWRKVLRKADRDPFGDKDTDDVNRKALDELIIGGPPDAAGVVLAAIDDFSQELARIVSHFLKLKAWRGTERIVVGGGMRATRIGELVIGLTDVRLQADDMDVELVPIRHDPDEAGLIGAAHLAPSWMFKGYDGILAVDIGGTNIRTGVVRLNLKRASDLSKADVWKCEQWRHGDEKVNRADAVGGLIDMLLDLIAKAEKEDLKLAPFIGVGCPGKIDEDGSIVKGAQNLPGNWESSRFNLPLALRDAIPTIDEHETAVVIHNDAVVQGLSEAPFMRDVKHWGVLTIGTGLGNARFTNRERPDE
jgi:hypothetical protein